MKFSTIATAVFAATAPAYPQVQANQLSKLAVPGTEDYEQVPIKTNPVRRRKLRKKLKGKLLLLMMCFWDTDFST